MTLQDTHSWRQSLLPPVTSMRDVIHNLDATGLQITLVVGPQDQLLGVVTDGDVRRALIRGLPMDTPAQDFMFKTPMVVPEDMGRDTVLQLMRANKIHQLPVVNAQQHVIGLHVWDDVLAPTTLPNTFVIMAGGFGKRLQPYTDTCPKPMLPVAGKPMLEHIIERAKAEGFTDFIISTHYLAHVIQNYFEDGHKWGVRVRYIHEEHPLGTAGALSLLTEKPSHPFVVTNGDVMTDIRYQDVVNFHQHHHAQATMAVRQHEWQHPFGVVRTNGIHITGFEEKPIHKSHVNAGIYVLAPAVLDLLTKDQPCDMPTLFAMVQQQGQPVIAYPMHEPWLDVGRQEDLLKANSL